MRDAVNTSSYNLRRHLFNALHYLCPHWFTPLYAMVSFSNVPYAEVVRRDARHRWWYGVVLGVCRWGVVGGLAVCAMRRVGLPRCASLCHAWRRLVSLPSSR